MDRRQLVIFGGGHIGKELLRIASGSDFAISVVDDREDFLSDLPDGVDTFATDENYSTNLPDLGPDCFVVIVTRSHKCDQQILRHVLNTDCAYVGMIGSKSKAAQLFRNLAEEDFDKTRIDKVKTPVGINIKAEGPHEIAVSILAEVIAAKNGAL